MLTITISVASGADALFSFLPSSMQGLKLFTEVFLILGLIFLNLRGTKESVQFLLPFFLWLLLKRGVGLPGPWNRIGGLPAVVFRFIGEFLGDGAGSGYGALLGFLFPL